MTKFYCVAPFRQVYIDSVGISACCMQGRHQTTLEQWDTHPALLSLQMDFLEGNIPNGCKQCIDDEQLLKTSLRIQNNQDYNNEIFTDTTIEFIDYRSSNLCNFKCRSCNPIFSHNIAKEVNDNPDVLKNFFPITKKYLQVSDENLEWITKNINQIKRLMFTGGEPTVMPNVQSIIQMLIDNDRTDVPVLITTNCSFTDSFWKEIVSYFPNLHWTLSIDAVGPAATIIRHGTDWNIVESNVRWLASNASSVMINTVITNLNIFQLSPLLTFVRDLQKQNKNKNNGLDHRFHVSQRPYYLSADNLTPNLKNKALEYLEHCSVLDLDHSQRETIISLTKMLDNSIFNQSLWDQSCQYNSELDRIRNQDHTQLFPKQ